MDEKQRIKLEDLISELEQYRGRHTELITIYAPAGANINQINSQVEQEKSTAINIKSKSNRKNVLDALERISRNLKLFKQIPKNGLAIFCGNISENEGQPKIEVWSIEPPVELKVKLYRCDQTFLLEPLKEMLSAISVYGLVVVDRKEATVGILEGKNIKMIRHMTSGAPGKVRAGGQSAQRFKRVTEEIVKEFYRRVADALKDAFFDNKKLEGILVGGPGPTKEDFLKEGELVTSLQKKIKAVKDIGYSGVSGLKELVDASQDILAKEGITKEVEILKKFFMLLGKSPEKVAYKEDAVRKALTIGAVDKLIISKSFDKLRIRQLEEEAANIDAEVIFISTETEEGVQFKNLGGLGAFLRFAI